MRTSSWRPLSGLLFNLFLCNLSSAAPTLGVMDWPAPDPTHWRGVNLSGMEWGAGVRRDGSTGQCHADEGQIAGHCWSTPPSSAYDNLARWGFNMVRLPISWANLEPAPSTSALAHQYNAAYLADLDRVLDNLAARRLKVVLSMHQVYWSPAYTFVTDDNRNHLGAGMPVWLYATEKPADIGLAKCAFFANLNREQDGFVAAWRFLAARYANHPAVMGADLINEPNLKANYERDTLASCDAKSLDDLYQNSAAAIQGVAPQWYLAFQDSASTPVTNPPAGPSVYSFHLYAKDWAKALDNHRLLKAQRWHLPLWVGEFQSYGPLPDSGTGQSGPETLEATEPVLHSMNADNSGWTYWAYSLTQRPLGGEFGNGPVDWPLVNLLSRYTRPPVM